ncbi:hypothetical protein AHFPHNDE_02918 [Pseudomonas sp. MM227]|uniref:hypothetical protein n=1 Tax=unclassified Pseudomonas TaxID=196821 RepID=UPI000F03F4CB|nr:MULTISPECIES: hypothetical protein [unclassified Pseudomonas]MBD8622976.1 hypothetical protein [Pseudomonas sp. CFBP 13727]MBD8732987.1 hypothetical protein [Pseudomonas sp. CFBP 13710]MBD8825854.1 hypothetical protein [Pseudomonas sp. CFBP 13602]CAI3789229.1 hypothetical protein AHFPHNDE_02918 [Pseudomonas sp. MM227]
MKSSHGFNARRLRKRAPGGWRYRLGAGLGAVLLTLGLLLAMAGVATLLGHPPQIIGLDTTTSGAAILAGMGLLVLYLGLWLWRRSRRGMRRSRELGLAPHLMKKHD